MIPYKLIQKYSSTTRFNGTFLIEQETVSQHVVEMCLLCQNFSSLIEEKIDIRDIYYRCIIHDLDEAVSCDIPRPLKYATPKVKEAIEEATKLLLKEEIKDEKFLSEIDLAKNPNTLEGYLVSIADAIQCYMKMNKEVNILNNKILESDLNNFKSYIIYEIIPNISTSNLKSESRSALTKYILSLIN